MYTKAIRTQIINSYSCAKWTVSSKKFNQDNFA